MIKYDNYKDSGTEWLGQIPEHWKKTRLKDFGNLQNGVSRGKEYFGTGHPFVSYSNVYNNCVSIEHIKTLANSSPYEQKLYSVKENDILFTRTSETVDEIGFAATVLKTINKAAFSGFVIRFRPKKILIIKEFSKYLFRANIYRNYLSKEIALVTRASLNQNILGCLTVIMPPLPEQTAIAQYLDDKTQAIDKKVTLLQQKISYYKELRKSIINKAVTKGLNPEVEMKDSNIDWIGQIPNHWEVKRVKDLFVISRGRVISKEELLDDGKYPVYSSQTENQGILGMIDTYDFDADLITWTTDGVNAGTVFRRQGKFSCTNICGTLIPKNSNKISLDYFGYSIAESAKHNKRIDTNGAKIMSNEMAFIQIINPPKAEQIAIANYLDEKTTQIDSIVNNIEQQIEKLKELRKTLINNVVTGKIKVA